MILYLILNILTSFLQIFKILTIFYITNEMKCTIYVDSVILQFRILYFALFRLILSRVARVKF